jgi:hypothetical protein
VTFLEDFLETAICKKMMELFDTSTTHIQYGGTVCVTPHYSNKCPTAEKAKTKNRNGDKKDRNIERDSGKTKPSQLTSDRVVVVW